MKKINTKNILKKIFKGKTANKVKKKVSKKKVVKAKKIIKTKKVKKVKKVISKKLKKTISKKSKPKKTSLTAETTVESKVDNLRISKSNEVKPEIK